MKNKLIPIIMFQIIALCGCSGDNLNSNTLDSNNSVSDTSDESVINESSDTSLESSSNINNESSSIALEMQEDNLLSPSFGLYRDLTSYITQSVLNKNTLQLTINNNSPESEDSTKVENGPLSVIKDHTYKCSFQVLSNRTRNVKLNVSDTSKSVNYLDQSILLEESTLQSVEYSFKATDDSSNVYWSFLTGKIGDNYDGQHSIRLSNIQVLDMGIVADVVDNMTTPVLSGYNVLWSDEFNGTELSSDWGYEIGGSGWGNDELQYYTNSKENSYVSEGTLKIVAKKQSMGNRAYTSARLITKNKFQFRYGHVEARIAAPSIVGVWPAYWMLGANNSWPYCGEIDIMEAINNEKNKAYSTLHWNNGSSLPSSTYNPAEYGLGYDIEDRTAFHTYVMDWTAGNISISVDGKSVFSMNISNQNGLEAFQNDFYFLLNVAVGGRWPGFTVDPSFTSQTMSVDYIRVYQRS